MIFPIKPYKTQLLSGGLSIATFVYRTQNFSAVAQRVSRQANLNGNLAAGYELKSQLIRAANNVWPMASHSLLRKYQQMWLGLKLSKLTLFQRYPAPSPRWMLLAQHNASRNDWYCAVALALFSALICQWGESKPRGCWCLECLETPENHEQLNSPC